MFHFTILLVGILAPLVISNPIIHIKCGPNRTDCILTYECVIGSEDAYAVCCPRRQQSVTTVTKPGSCPKPSGGIGSCISRWTYDSDCEGDLKCCVGCPRLCVKPLFRGCIWTG